MNSYLIVKVDDGGHLGRNIEFKENNLEMDYSPEGYQWQKDVYTFDVDKAYKFNKEEAEDIIKRCRWRSVRYILIESKNKNEKEIFENILKEVPGAYGIIYSYENWEGHKTKENKVFYHSSEMDTYISDMHFYNDIYFFDMVTI